MSHIHSTENLIFERLQQRQREQSQRPQISADTPHPGRTRRLVGNLGTFFTSMGTKLRQIKQHSKSAI